MRKQLTDRTLKALKPAPPGKRNLLMDSLVPQLGVSTTDKGATTFVLLTRFPGSPNPTRRALGSYPVMTLEQARAKAREWLAMIARGVDPRDADQRQRAAEQAARAQTFKAEAERYLARVVAKQRRAKETTREFRQDLLSRWADRPVAEITRADVIRMVDDVVARGAERQAHNILGLCKTFFNHLVDRGVLEASPCDRLRPTRLIGEKRIRQRVLTDEELRAVWRAAVRDGYPHGSMVKLLLLTGVRKTEAAGARWQEFDSAARLWTIPPERFKSNAVHTVPLSDDAVELLEALPRWQGDYLFSARGSGGTPVNFGGRAKRRLDKLVEEELGRPPEAWVLHDIRRTVRTRLAELRVSFEVAEMVIGHAKRGLGRVYDQHQYADEMREALDKWAARLRSIIDPPPANVVALRA